MKEATCLDTPSPRASVGWYLEIRQPDDVIGQRATALLLLFRFKRMKRGESGEFKVKTERTITAPKL